MHRVVVALAIALLLALSAAPVGAQTQRDPFRPVIDPDAQTTTTTTGDGTVVVEPAPADEGPVRSDGLANTGSELLPWATVAVGLMLVGGGALITARAYRKPLV